MIASAAPRGLGPLKLAAIGGLFFYALALFYAVVKAQNDQGFHPTVALVLAGLPLMLALSVRWPLTVPFILYVGLLPFDAVLGSNGGTLPRIAAILLGTIVVVHIAIRRQGCRPGPAWYAWLALVGYMTLSLLWTADPNSGQTIDFTVLQLFGMMTALVIYPISAWEFDLAMAWIVPCGVAAAGYAVHAYLSGEVMDRDSAEGNRVAIASSSGAVLDANAFAASFVLPIAVSLAFAFFGQKLAWRITCAVAALLMIAGNLVTGSRGGFLSALAVIVYFGIRTKYRVQIGALIACGSGLMLLFPQVIERFVNDPSAAGSGSGRTFIWETGLHSLRDHWLFGSGLGSFPIIYDRNFFDVYQKSFQGWSRPPHSLIVEALVELGVVGFVVTICAWAGSFIQLRAVRRDSPRYGFRIGFEAALIGLFGMSLTVDPTYIKYMWLAQTLPLMLLNVERPAYFLSSRLRR